MAMLLSQLDIAPGLARRDPMSVRHEFDRLGHRSPGAQQLDGQIDPLRDLIAPGSASHATNILPQTSLLPQTPLAALDIETNVELEVALCVGGDISPMIANMALDGLETRVRSAAPKRESKNAPRPKVHIIRYADDLVATARTRRMLQQRVISAIGAFLKERGLNLSQEKSRIVHIKDGFDFLGANVRKYKGKLLMRPTRANVIAFVRSIKEYIQSHRTIKTEHLIHQLNRRLRGWANAFRHLVSGRAFRFVDYCVFRQLWRWARKRHGNKGVKWVWRKYFHTRKNGSWAFYARSRTKTGRPKAVVLFRVTSLGIRRHVKIQAKARVHEPAYDAYFEHRRQRQRDARQHDYYRWLDYQRLELTA